MPNCVIAAVLKGWCQGCPSKARFHAHNPRCPFGCNGRYDSIGHLVLCRRFRDVYAQLSGLQCDRSPLAILGLGQDSPFHARRAYGAMYGLNIAIGTFLNGTSAFRIFDVATERLKFARGESLALNEAYSNPVGPCIPTSRCALHPRYSNESALDYYSDTDVFSE